jgi:hypothetical protein
MANDRYGVVYFGSLDPAEWLDAMERLCVLEQLCLDANWATGRFLDDLWRDLVRPLELPEDAVESEEIAPFPDGVRKSGPKHREPL